MDNGCESGENRSLVISDFRNLGVSSLKRNESDRTVLKINRCLDRDRFGGLVILLGSNNSGKTNILDAMTKFRRNEFDESADRTDFLNTPKKPTLRLETAGGKYGRIAAPKILPGTGRCKVMGTVPKVLLYILRQRESYDLYVRFCEESGEKAVNAESYMNYNEENVRLLCQGKGRGLVYSYILRNREGLIGEGLPEIMGRLEDDDISDVSDERLEISVKGTPMDSVVFVGYENVEGFGKIPRYIESSRLEEYEEQQSKIKRIVRKVSSTITNGRSDKSLDDDVFITDLSGGVKETELIPDAFSKRYGYNISDRVFRYVHRKISEADMTCSPDRLSDFMTNVFALLGYENSSIVNKQYENHRIRVKLEEDLNRELESVSEKLNVLLNSAEREYKLHIRLETNMIKLLIDCGGNSLNLDHQSMGFRWLFAFFINFLMSKKFVAGDMVVMDEFGALLNFGTVDELTKLLRSFARRNGITFIIASQNPMVIDIDHLDEIRMVVPRANGTSDILNDFTEFGNGECTDILRPIVSSMTVGRNYLRTKDRVTVFVERYIDYFLLCGFKGRLNEFDIDFIPVIGITDSTSVETISDALRSIERNPILLTDEFMHNTDDLDVLRDNRVQIYTVSEIFGDDRITVSDILSDGDRSRLKLDNMTFDDAAGMSWTIPEDGSMSEDTVDNFRRLLDYISLG